MRYSLSSHLTEYIENYTDVSEKTAIPANRRKSRTTGLPHSNLTSLPLPRPPDDQPAPPLANAARPMSSAKPARREKSVRIRLPGAEPHATEPRCASKPPSTPSRLANALMLRRSRSKSPSRGVAMATLRRDARNHGNAAGAGAPRRASSFRGADERSHGWRPVGADLWRKTSELTAGSPRRRDEADSPPQCMDKCPICETVIATITYIG